MFKLVNGTENHDFYHDPDSNSFRIVPKDMPCGLGGYRYIFPIMLKYGYVQAWDGEIKAREIFFGIKPKTKKKRI